MDLKSLVLPLQNIGKVRRKALKSAERKLYELVFTSKTPVSPLSNKSTQTSFNSVHLKERSYTRIESSLSVYPKLVKVFLQ